jgi:TPR repeat protein
VRLASLLEMGEGMRGDGPRALALSRRGCALGLDQACMTEAGLLESGFAGSRDLPRAARLLRATCDRGFAPACNAAGLHRMAGMGGPADRAGAIADCFSPAPDARWGEWCFTAGFEMERAAPTSPPDLDQAARLYQHDCELHFGPGCFRAGLIELGRGDAAKAGTFFKQACQASVEQACRGSNAGPRRPLDD